MATDVIKNDTQRDDLESTKNKLNEYDKILHKLESYNLLKFVTQLLNAHDLFNVMIVNEAFFKRITGCLINHLNRTYIEQFPKFFQYNFPKGNRVLDYFKVYCVYYGNEKRTPIYCREQFMRKDVERCKMQLKKFVKTLQPGAIQRDGRDLNNFLEYPNHETIVFKVQNSNTGNMLLGELTWKNKLFPIMIKYNNEEFVFQFCIDDQEKNCQYGQYNFLYSNSNGRIIISFDEITFSNPPAFLLCNAALAHVKKILPTKAMDFFFHGLWCDVQQLEQFARIEEFKNSLRPNGISYRYHNELTFQNGVLAYKHILSSNSMERSRLVWNHDKFPLIIKHKGKGFVFQCILPSDDGEHHVWKYVDTLKNQNEHKREAIYIHLLKDLQFPIEQKRFSDLVIKAKKYTDESFTASNWGKTISAAEVFEEGLWCDIKLIEDAVKEFQEENQ